MGDEHHFWFMDIAISEAVKAAETCSAFSVGAVLVLNGEEISRAHSREIEGNTHAEECCLLKLQNRKLAQNATIYSTMEPCGRRLSGNTCCAKLIIEAGISKVVFGCIEPETFVGKSAGMKMLVDAGIEVIYLKEYEQAALDVNKHLLM